LEQLCHHFGTPVLAWKSFLYHNIGVSVDEKKNLIDGSTSLRKGVFSGTWDGGFAGFTREKPSIIRALIKRFTAK